ncbi:hypothetical protein LZC95_41550 [Pendulispora brunnea]|uniref:Uncharacterized protein n=1 Tax=Pendulispora brunnea TaxID=2905690 RepID=A0ABZ2K2H1_9BACT
MMHRYQMVPERTRPVVLPASTYTFPLHTTLDYARIAAFQSEQPAPVLLDHAQYFEFLSKWADALWAALGEKAHLFIEVRMPYVGTLPDNLLRPEVLLGAHLFAEAASCGEYAEYPVVWISDRIRRDLDYPSDNSLNLAVWPTPCTSAVEATLERSWPEYAMTFIKIR